MAKHQCVSESNQKGTGSGFCKQNGGRAAEAARGFLVPNRRYGEHREHFARHRSPPVSALFQGPRTDAPGGTISGVMRLAHVSMAIACYCARKWLEQWTEVNQ